MDILVQIYFLLNEMQELNQLKKQHHLLPLKMIVELNDNLLNVLYLQHYLKQLLIEIINLKLKYLMKTNHQHYYLMFVQLVTMCHQYL